MQSDRKQTKHFNNPTRPDQEMYLVRLYFGPVGPRSNYLQLCIRRAYLDFSRPLHGIRNMPGLYEKPSAEIERAIVEMRDNGKITSQVAFDEWHRACCERIKFVYAKNGYKKFHIGQAQKWINMTFKYIYAIGDKRLPGYGHLYPFGHIPLEQIPIHFTVLESTL